MSTELFAIQRGRFLLVLLLAVLLTACGPGAEVHPPLPTMSLDPERFYVAGLSSGGSKAQHLYLSWPDEVKGIAVFAAAPYGCARAGVNAALFQCMGTRGGRPDPGRLAQQIRADAAEGKLGDLTALATTRAFVYQAGQDAVIAAAVTDATATLYGQLLPRQQLQLSRHPDAGHGFPAGSLGVACSSSESPYVNACGFDGAGLSLDHLDASPGRPLLTSHQGELQRFSQRPFSGNSRGMADYGYLYQPPTCRGNAECGLKMVLHGCEQGAEVVGTDFIKQSGYLQQADARNLVLVFPQVSKTLPNPKGCWDWWGYESSAFDTREGPQVQALRGIWQQLLNGNSPELQ